MGFIGFLLIASVASAISFDSLLAWVAGILYVVYDTWLLTYVAWKTRKLGVVNSKQTNQPVKVSTLPSTTPLSLGVLVAVHNESDVILGTLSRLLSQSVTPSQIIIVNDGSSDDTLQKVSAMYGFDVPLGPAQDKLYQSNHCPHLFLLHKPNSGKADSLNNALQYITTEVALTVDADTILEIDAIKQIHSAFSQDKNLVAACGILRPTTQGKLFAKIFGGLQYFEYLRAFLSRAAWSESNALLLVSGAFSAYHTKALAKVGGYDPASLVEDYELIHRMHRYSAQHDLDWRVDVIEKARATTDAPTNINAFIQQRKRWFAGFLRTQFKYRDMIGFAQYKEVGRFMLPVKTVDTLQPIFGLTALYLLILFIFTDVQVANYILAVIAIKLVIDYTFHLWSLHKYHQWIGQSVPAHKWWQATFCCLCDPFFFQPLRHISALVGWSMVLKNNVRWEPIRIHSDD